MVPEYQDVEIFIYRTLSEFRSYSILHTMREKCPHMEFFLVRIFLHLDRIGRDTEYNLAF